MRRFNQLSLFIFGFILRVMQSMTFPESQAIPFVIAVVTLTYEQDSHQVHINHGFQDKNANRTLGWTKASAVYIVHACMKEGKVASQEVRYSTIFYALQLLPTTIHFRIFGSMISLTLGSINLLPRLLPRFLTLRKLTSTSTWGLVQARPYSRA